MVTPGPTPFPDREAEDLEQRYTAYRRRQAARLMHLLPREAIRPVYREALAGEGRVENPLELLLNYCETLLPLPPFEVWREDLRRSPEAHLRDLDESPQPPTRRSPSTVEVRTVAYGGCTWMATLKSYRDDGVWRGYIAFADPEAGSVHRTAPIFREGDPVTLRDRFLSFEPPALEAFLRSALP